VTSRSADSGVSEGFDRGSGPHALPPVASEKTTSPTIGNRDAASAIT
jgi:hypothetical protein